MREQNTHRNIPVNSDRRGHSCACVEAPPSALQYVRVTELKRIRKARKLSQADLAEMTGLSQGMISKIERGTGNPTLEAMIKIAEALKVHPAVLFGGLPERHQRLIDRFEAMSPEMRKHFEAVLFSIPLDDH